MVNLKNLSVSNQIVITLTTLSIIFLLIGVLIYSGIQSTKEKTVFLTGYTMQKLRLIDDVEESIGKVQSLILRHILTHDTLLMNTVEQSVHHIYNINTENLGKYKNYIVNVKGNKLYNDVLTKRKTYWNLCEQVLEICRQKKDKEAFAFVNKELNQVYNDYELALEKLETFAENEGNDIGIAVTYYIDQLVKYSNGFLGLGIIVVISMGFVVTRVTHRLKKENIILQDEINQREIAKESLRNSERRFATTLSSIGDAVIATDCKGSIKFMNGISEILTGWDESDAIGKNLTEVFNIINEETREAVKNPVEEVLQKGVIVRLATHTILISKDGKEYPIDDSAAPIKDEEGNITGVVLVFHDITEHKGILNSLQQAEAKYKALFINANDSIFLMTEDTFVECNPKTEEMFGCRREEILTQKPYKFSPPFQPDKCDSKDKAHEKINAAFSGVPQVFEWKHKKLDGTLFDAEVSLNRIEIGDKKMLQAIVRDITERKRTELEQARLFEDLKQQSKISNALLCSALSVVEFRDVKTLLTKLLEQMIQITKADRCTVFLWDDVNEVFEPVASLAPFPEGVKLFERLRIHKGQIPAVDIVINEKKSVLVEDAEQGDLIPPRYLKWFGIKSILLVPFVKEDKLLGGFTLDYTKAAHHFTDEEKRLASGIANQAAIAVDNARLFEQLIVSEKKYRTLFEESKDTIYTSTPDGKLLDINRAGVELFGYDSREELLDVNVGDLYVDSISQEEFVKLIDQQGFVKDYELKVKKKNGENLVVQDSSNVVRDDTGRIVAYRGIMRDITERRWVEEKLRQREEQFRLISENVADMIAVHDLEGKRIYSSSSYKNILDDPESLLGTDAFQEIHPEDRERIKQKFQETVRTGIGQRAEFRILLKDGRICHIESQGSAIRDVNGKITQVIVVSRDVTEKKKYEQQLFQTQKLESIGKLASGIAHDFNNILGIILGYSDLLKLVKDKPEKFFKSVEVIMKATQRGASLVKQLLTFARKTDVLFESVNVNDVITDINNIMRETFPKTIEVTLDMQKDLPLITADKTQIHQVILNLCINARDAMPYGGTLSISTSTIYGNSLKSRFPKAISIQYVRIEVTDTGIGMDEVTRLRIFEPFYTTKDIGKGTGLGLSLVYGIVENHNGFIDVVSELGEGTTFIVYLPVQEQKTEIFGPSKIIVEDIPTGKETILLIEDEESLRELLTNVLISRGYSVITAEDGEQGLKVFLRHQKEIAVVVSDIGLPKISGKEVFEKIKATNPHTRVILASGFIDPNAKSELFKAGVKHFIQKPYSVVEVLQRIREVIDAHD